MLKLLLFVSLLISGTVASEIIVKPIHSISQIPSKRPLVGHYRLHLIDVGTGLSVLIQGNNWNLLYDAGSADDKAGNQQNGDSNSRVVAYLYKAIGKSGSSSCRPAEDGWATHIGTNQEIIDYIFLSHPHEDHGVMLDDVLECFKAKHVYDSGRINHTVFYRRFIEKVAEESGVIYKTAKKPNQNNIVKVKESSINLSDISWQQFKELDKVQLDDTASFTILHASASTSDKDPNSNSIVVRLDLGSKSLLLTGDAESGPRKLPHEEIDGLEKKLFEKHKSLIDTDILQVGHHGSLTSSRTKFVKAVSPKIALISAGPKKYKSVVLPDKEVVESLEFEGIHVLRTDSYDKLPCPINEKIGRDDNRAGGCANFILEW